MIKHHFILNDRYFDSIVLMEISAKLAKLPGVADASVMTGGEANQGLLQDTGFLDGPVAEAGGGDLLCCLLLEGDFDEAAARESLEEMLTSSSSRAAAEDDDWEPRSLEGGIEALPDANLLILSIPGPNVRWEGLKALTRGLNLLIFSDNVSVDAEIELKKEAEQRGLLVMGPDCGTAIIGGAALCFANVVRSGSIGLVGASGTGLQEVTCLIDQLGSGISHAIGTGGRDLSADVGGITMKQGIDLLAADEATKVIVLVSKPPDAAVAAAVLDRAKASGKPVVVVFLGADTKDDGNIHGALTLEAAAVRAVALAEDVPSTQLIEKLNMGIPKGVTPLGGVSGAEPLNKKKLRGFFCGGTLCGEAKLILKRRGIHLSATAAPGADLRHGRNLGEGHIVLDLGDDIFTVGRPHPMIDPSLRAEFVKSAAADPAVGIILLDVVGGYGSHEDPAGAMVESVQVAISAGKTVVASCCGTDTDPQPRHEQEAKLREIGVHLFPTAARAATFVADLLEGAGA